MTVDELLANHEKNENEKRDFLLLVKQRFESNLCENNFLKSIVDMSDDELNNFYYKVKENELNKELFRIKVNKDDHNTFSNFIITLLSMVTAFIAGVLSANISNIISNGIQVDFGGIIITVIIFLIIFSLIIILLYKFCFYNDTLLCSKSIKSKQSDLEDLKLNNLN